MKTFKKVLFASFLTCSGLYFPAQGQETETPENQFSIEAQLRPRAEFRHGAFQPLPRNSKPAALISQRTRLTFGYQYKNLLKVKLTPQMVSVWGQENMNQGTSVSNALTFFEAYGQLNINENAGFLIGRQVISLDDERFFGELDWAQGGRSHDAVSFQYKKPKGEFKAYFAFNQNYREIYGNNLSNVSGTHFSPKGAASYKWMQTVWGRYNISDKNAVSALISNVGFQNAADAIEDKAETYYTPTLGVNYFHTGSDWKAQASVYFQTGKNASGRETNAYLASAGFTRKINSKWDLGLAADIVSGNNIGETTKEKNNAFIPYFGTNHKFYGAMDYYYAGNGHSNIGLGDVYLSTAFSPIENLRLSAVFHQFIAPNKLDIGHKKLTKNLGQEIDFTVNYKINKYAGLVGGYSVYTASETTKLIKDVSNAKTGQHWVWLSLNINPKLFDFKN